MFCRVCGERNDETSLYCSKDGARLYEDEISLSMVKGNIKFCKECGGDILREDLYCSNCGSSLYNIGQVKKINKENIMEKSSNFSKFNISNPFKYSLIAVGIVLLISIISSKFINRAFMEAVSDQIGYNMDIKLISFFDVSTILNVSSINIDLLGDSSTLFNIKVSGMPFILPLILIGIFTILGIIISNIYGKKDQNIDFKEYFSIALFYGVTISIISLLASKKMNLNIPYLLDYSNFKKIIIVKKYGFLSTFIKSTFLLLFSLGLGNGIYNIFLNMKNRKKESTPLESACLILVASMLFIMMFILFGDKNNIDLYKDMYDGILGKGVMAQIFIYLLLFVNLGAFNMESDGESISASLFNDMGELKDLIQNTQYIYIGLFISVFLFFLFGRRFKKTGRNIKELFYTPILYSLGMGILAYLTSVNLSMNSFLQYGYDSAVSLSMGFNYLTIFMGSLLIFGLSSYSGYLLGKEEDGKEKVVSYE